MAAVMKNPKAIQFASPELRSNKEIMLVAIKKDIDTADFLDAGAWQNRDFVIEAVRVDWQLLRMACEEFLRDPEIVLAAIESNWDAVSVAAPEAWEYMKVPRAAAVTGGWTVHNVAPHYLQARLRADKEFALHCVRLDWRNLEKIDEELLEDFDIALAAVRQDWRALRWIHKDLQGHEEIVKVAVEHNFLCITKSLDELPIEQPLVLRIVQQNWEVFAYLTEELRSDKEIAYSAISQNWRALEFAGPARKNDPDIVGQACRQDPRAVMKAPLMLGHKGVMSIVVASDGMLLEKALEEVKEDPSIVKIAVAQNWEALQFASEHVRGMKDVVFPALKNDPSLTVMDWTAPSLRRDPVAMLEFLQHNKDIFPWVDDDLMVHERFIYNVSHDSKLGRKIIIQMVRRNWNCFEFVPDFLKGDPEIILTAAQQDWHAIEMAEDFYDCWTHPKIVLAAVSQDYNNIRNVNSSMLDTLSKVHKQVAWNDETCARYAILNGSVAVPAALENFAKIGPRLKSNKDFVMEVLGHDGKLLEFAAGSLKDDDEVVRAAIESDGLAIKFASERLCADFNMAQLAVQKDPGAVMFVDESLRQGHVLVDQSGA
eukprot:Skav200321  [mRNA]  locus=scaffold1760:34825:41939:- [translate_table: standard]